MTVTFEGYERRADKINKCLADNGIASLEEALQICTDKGFNPREIVNNTQSIAFQNAEWAYTLGCALAVKRGAKSASEAAAIIATFSCHMMATPSRTGSGSFCLRWRRVSNADISAGAKYEM